MIGKWYDCANHYGTKIKILSEIFKTKKNEILYEYIKTLDKIKSTERADTLIRLESHLIDLLNELDENEKIIKGYINEAVRLLQIARDHGEDQHNNVSCRDLNNVAFEANEILIQYHNELSFIQSNDDFSDDNFYYHYEENNK